LTPIPIIEIKNLSKSFGSLAAVTDLNLEVFRGDVFGFLGPNGAGKSTTIRMLLSLIKPTSGSIHLFGRNLQDHRNDSVRKIGCIIEKPDFYLYLSAAKNLELFSRLSGLLPAKSKIDEVLELVGLKGRAHDNVKTFSHGMKQRLGIAQTLIHDPELIILDEPTTGLDPQGIIDVRNLIRHLQHDLSKTVFLSSHILSEIELIATRMAILNNGKAVAQGNVSDLLSTQDLIVALEVEDAEKAMQWIAVTAWQSKLHAVSGQQFQLKLAKKEIPEFADDLHRAGIHFYSIAYKRALEDYFLRLTQESSSSQQRNKTPEFINRK
jgi:ABC-type multidrug transport system ATPase subunit